MGGALRQGEAPGPADQSGREQRRPISGRASWAAENSECLVFASDPPEYFVQVILNKHVYTFSFEKREMLGVGTFYLKSSSNQTLSNIYSGQLKILNTW